MVNVRLESTNTRPTAEHVVLSGMSPLAVVCGPTESEKEAGKRYGFKDFPLNE